MGERTSCPYCGTLECTPILRMTMPTLLSACKPEEVERSHLFPFEASLCPSCGLGFNSKPLDDETLEAIYRNYRYIRPGKGVGVSKYVGILECVERNVKRDDFLVEIGASDGYVLDTLSDRGYQNLQGFEPSRECLHSRYPDRIRNEFFGEQTVLHRLADAFLLFHVLEHFSSPLKMIQLMRSMLAPGGRIIFEVPNFRGFHHQHLVFLSPYFVRRLASDMNLAVHEIYCDQKILRVVLAEPAEPEEVAPVVEGNTVDEAFPSLLLSPEGVMGKLCSFLHKYKGKEVIWWGTGSTSIMALANLEENIIPLSRLLLVDGDPDREGLVLPIPAFAKRPILFAPRAYENMRQEHVLVIASEYRKEILNRIATECPDTQQVDCFHIDLP